MKIWGMLTLLCISDICATEASGEVERSDIDIPANVLLLAGYINEYSSMEDLGDLDKCNESKTDLGAQQSTIDQDLYKRRTVVFENTYLEYTTLPTRFTDCFSPLKDLEGLNTNIKVQQPTVDPDLYKRRTVVFENTYPGYTPLPFRFTNYFSPYKVEIPDGSLISFATDDKFAFFHRNNLDITHTEVILNFDPRTIRDLINSGKAVDFGNEVLKEMSMYHGSVLTNRSTSEILVPFVFASCDLTYKSKKRSMQYIKLLPLETVIAKYTGNIYLRKLQTTIDPDKSLEFVLWYIGHQEEYPSSLTALFYQYQGLIQSSEVLAFPNSEQFIYGEQEDLFRDIAGEEIMLKRKF